MPHLSKEESRALIASAIIIALITCTTAGIIKCGKNDEFILTEQDIAEAELFEKEINQRQKDRGNQYGAINTNATLFAFDPNHADSATLREVGLRERQVKNILKYRRKGGVWRSVEDFKRLYGLTTEEYERLKPYIRILPSDRRRDDAEYEGPNPIYPRQRPQVSYVKTEKYAEGTVISLNEADTATLKHIPGIGSHYARKIVEYGERLGGYISIAQLEEIEGLPPGITRWFKLNGNEKVNYIRINHATFKQLVRHPYLSYEQTKIIVNHIHRYGPIHNWSDLRLYKEFSDRDFERLTPYIVFN